MPRKEAEKERCSSIDEHGHERESELTPPPPPPHGEEPPQQSQALPKVTSSAVNVFLSKIQHSRNRGLGKTGADYYSAIFAVELLAAFVILVGYSSMATTTNVSVAASFNTNMFSGAMVILLLAQVLFIVFDRIVFLYRSEILKLLFQYFQLYYWLDKLVFIWPTEAQIGVAENSTLLFFIFLKSVYFFLSALQLKHGYTSYEGDTRYTENVTIIRGRLFQVYQAIPFVYELRILLDWVCRSTTLDLMEYFKLEDIHARLYIVKVDLLTRNKRKRGEEQHVTDKLLLGVVLFFVLLLVIFLPLILFSSANPATSLNNVTGCSFDVSISCSTGAFKLASVSSIALIRTVDISEYSFMKDQRIIFNQPQNQIQVVRLAQYADNYWQLTPPNRATLNKVLGDFNKTVELDLSYSFTRPGPDEAKTIFGVRSQSLDVDTRVALQQLMDVKDDKTKRKTVTISNSLPMYVRLPSSGEPEILPNADFSSLQLTLASDDRDDTDPNNYWWQFTTGAEDGVQFITVSNVILSSVLSVGLSGGIIAVYVTIVLTVGRLVRLAFADLMQRVMYEDMQGVDPLLMFIDGIYIARLRKDLRKEEELFRQLLYIYRSPRLLMMLTKRKQEDTDTGTGTSQQHRQPQAALAMSPSSSISTMDAGAPKVNLNAPPHGGSSHHPLDAAIESFLQDDVDEKAWHENDPRAENRDTGSALRRRRK